MSGASPRHRVHRYGTSLFAESSSSASVPCVGPLRISRRETSPLGRRHLAGSYGRVLRSALRHSRATLLPLICDYRINPFLERPQGEDQQSDSTSAWITISWDPDPSTGFRRLSTEESSPYVRATSPTHTVSPGSRQTALVSPMMGEFRSSP